MARRRHVLHVLLVLALGAPAALEAQGPLAHDSLYRALRALGPDGTRAATVRGLSITRAGGRLVLEDGTLWLAAPVFGRTVGAVYVGSGQFEFTAPSALERGQIASVLGDSVLRAPIRAVVLLFADSTAAELDRALTFAPREPDRAARALFDDALLYLRSRDEETLEAGLMTPLLNGATARSFYAHVDRANGGPVMLVLDPHEREASQLRMRARNAAFLRTTESVSQFAPDGSTGRDYVAGPLVSHYDMDVTLARSTMGEARFAAAARLTITSPVAAGPWLPFYLAAKLEVDSVRSASGMPLAFHKDRDGERLWIRLDTPLAAGESREVQLGYHGDLIDRYGDFFFIKSSSFWYPRPLDARTRATFDLTYHTPASYRFASVGVLADSSVADKVLTTRWTTPHPIRNASFNLGFFEDHRVEAEGAPAVTVLFSDQANRELGIVTGPRAKERVGQDVLDALRFYTAMFGPLPVDHVYATQIPYFHGEAFDGLVHLSLVTFASSESSNAREHNMAFRAHEVAHQWWGIGVDFTSYRDQWLSEGLSQFSALWYTQVAQKQNDYYFDELRRWRGGLEVRRGDLGPVWLGYRTATPRDGSEYGLVVYEKGAWVLHMLRILMLDFRTMNEDRFTGALREYYQSHRGGSASSADLRRAMERHAGADLGWFFDQWLGTSAMPEYRWAWRTEPGADGKHRVFLRVEQRRVPETFLAYVPVTITLKGGGTARMRVKVTGATTETELTPMPDEPVDLVFNDLEGVLASVSKTGW